MPSAADLTKQIAQRLEELAQATDAARQSEEMQTYLAACSRFYTYSPRNQMLIAIQKPDATHVAGYTRWKDFNRYVRRGEHGIAILAPCTYKKELDDETATTLTGFRVAYVFDISQTDGEPLPDEPNWKSPELQVVLQGALFQYAASLGITIEIKDLVNAQGFSSGGAITLDTSAGTKTLIHELAHELLHKHGDHTDRQTREIEAESVAYVVASHFGLSDLACPNYLAFFQADSKSIMARLKNIQSAAMQIINAIEPSI